MKEKIKLPKELISLSKKITPLSLIYGKKREYKLPSGGGLYCFWWIGRKKDLMSSTRTIKLKGSKKRLIRSEFEDWFPADLPSIPLYVGKATSIRKRVPKHLFLKSANRIHKKPVSFKKNKPKTTTCQLRTGIEHIFPDENNVLDLILNNVGISYTELNGDKFVSQRFYLEDFAIGYLRPWFNLDSER